MTMDITLKPNEILVLRDVRADMTSRNGFHWPKSGSVEAPDWRDDDKCGGGLHGLPWGVGGDYRIGGSDATWLVVRVCTDPGNYQHGSGKMCDKCKFREGEVVFCGSREDAVEIIARYAPDGARTNWSTQTAGNGSTQTAGNGSTQTAGNESTQTAGNESTQTAGHWSTQKAGDGSTQTAGYESTQTAGNGSTQTAGHWSTQKAGHWSTQTAGYGSTQTAGNGSTQTAGDESTQKAGDEACHRAGVGSVQITRWYDSNLRRYRTAARVVTDAEANKWYRASRGVWTELTDKEVAEIESRLLK
jgi:hypothetical protein